MSPYPNVLLYKRTSVSAITPSTKAKYFWSGLVMIGLAAVGLRASLLNSFPLSPDEGIHLIWLRLLSAGYQPYREVYITYPPLYPLAIETVWNLWPTEAAQRWFSVAYTLFGVAGIALLARKLAGDAAGLTATALALVSPVLMEPSRAVLGEFPSVAWSVWAVWLAWLYKDSHQHHRLWLVLSGVCLSASLLTKLLSPFLLGLIPLFILTRNVQPAPPNFDRKNLVTDTLLWGLALLLPVIIFLLMYDPAAMLRQVVEQRLLARTAYMDDQTFWTPRLEYFRQFATEDLPLLLLGLAGLGWSTLRRQKDRWILPVWLALALAMLAIHNPVRYKHFLILIPILSIGAGTALSDWAGYVCQLRTRPRSWRVVIISLTGLLALIMLYSVHILAAVNLWRVKAQAAGIPADEQEALAFITAVTAPTDCLITDDAQLAYWSGRMVPPELAEVSSNRLKSGALTLPELIDITDRYDCQLVAAVSNRIPKYLPGYMDWVKSKYLGMFHYGEDDLFFAKADTDSNPASPLWASFDDQIVFYGYTLSGLPAHPGDRLPLTLVWQALQRPPENYTIFVQLRDLQNVVLASADHQPYQGYLPTTHWPAGAVVQEVIWLNLPPDIPPGRYNLYIGLYRPDTGARLPLRNDASGENALLLSAVEINHR